MKARFTVSILQVICFNCDKKHNWRVIKPNEGWSKSILHRKGKNWDVDENRNSFAASWSRTQLAGIVWWHLQKYLVAILNFLEMVNLKVGAVALIGLVLKAVNLWVALVGKRNTRTAEGQDGELFLSKFDENHLSQVNVSSGQEERVRDMKELGDGADSLPHTPASDPE